MDRRELLHKIQELGFCCVEANLYLDAYPDNAEALSYFNHMTEEYQKAVAEYESVCGPLTAAANGPDAWNWVSTPWPWELGVN